MKLLAIETSTMLGGAALIDDTGLISETRLNVRVAHSERLMAEVDHMLRQAGLGIKDVEVFAASGGPGSFTGLRVGLSTLKGLAFSTGKPVLTVPTLEAFAWNFPECAHPVCLLFDARKKEVYAGVFLWEAGVLKRLLPETAVGIGGLLEALHNAGYEKFLFAGEGAMIYKEEIEQGLGGGAIFAPAHLMVPLPSSVAALAFRRAKEGLFENPEKLTPHYIRKAEAELKLP